MADVAHSASARLTLLSLSVCSRLLLGMAEPVIRIVNARQHNLHGLTVDLPRRKLIVITGPSGSGKSSLAFDTLYAEGQRRYIESLSTYAKQFLERMPKPQVDRLEGLAPAVAIEQRNPTVSSRSTVGTATEIYDYLRLLWARVGRQRCRKCGAPGPARHAAVGDRGDTEPDQPDRCRSRFRSPNRPVTATRPSSRTCARWDSSVSWGTVSQYHLDALPPTVDLTQCAELLIVVDRLMLQGAGGGDFISVGCPSHRCHRDRLRRGRRHRTGSPSAMAGFASPSIRRAVAVIRRPRRLPRRSSPSTIRGARAAAATVSARCWSTTSR